MAAYVIVTWTELKDDEKLAKYRALAGPSVAAAGGKYIVRGGPVEVLEGAVLPERVVVIEFADVDTARSWYHGEGYAAARAERAGAAEASFILVEGA